MQRGITLIEICIAMVLLMLAIPCILNSFQKDHSNHKKVELDFIKNLNNTSKNCLNITTKNMNILECKTLNDKLFYKIQ